MAAASGGPDGLDSVDFVVDPNDPSVIHMDNAEDDEDDLLMADDDNDPIATSTTTSMPPPAKMIPPQQQPIPENDDDEAEVFLERLPRPVNELNCRQARSNLVRLLRAANGNQNPAYGNPKKRPPFWPDSYWPWEKLTDVHTKPRGMTEPLQGRSLIKRISGDKNYS